MIRARAVWQLLRIPNLFTAVADVVAGFLLAGAESDRTSVLLVLSAASACLYAGGVALNDVFDAKRDARERPDRPIPAGAITRTQAAWLGGVLLAAGCLLCAAVGSQPRAIGLALAACVVAYDGVLKRTPLAPAAMGVCRVLNLMLGMSAVAGWKTGTAIGAAGLLWLYTASLTFFARREARITPSARLRLGASGMAIAVFGLAGLQTLVDEIHPSYLPAVGVLLGLVTIRTAGAIRTCEPADVQRAVTTCVLSIVLFDACLVCAVRGPWFGLAVLALAVPAVLLARRYRVT